MANEPRPLPALAPYAEHSFAAFVALRYVSVGRRSQLVSFMSALTVSGLALGIAILTWTGVISIASLLVFEVIGGIAASFAQPARQALVSRGRQRRTARMADSDSDAGPDVHAPLSGRTIKCQ